MGSPPSKPWQHIMDDAIALHWPDDGARVLHLCQQARDYIEFETGDAPDMAYVKETMTDAPPTVPTDQLWCWGHLGQDGALDGIATCLKGYYEANEWYLGLLLLAPAARASGLGRRMAQHVIDQARADNATCLRLAVLDTNIRAHAFWRRLNFRHEKSTSIGDGQLRHVHRMNFDREYIQ